MRLIYGHDYYDGVDAADRSLEFIRKPIIIGDHIFKNARLYTMGYRDILLEMHAIAFCGKLYPVVKLYNCRPNTLPIISWHYSLESMQAALPSGHALPTKKTRKYINPDFDFTTHRNMFSKLENYLTGCNATNWLIDNKIITGILEPKKSEPSFTSGIANLKDYEFYKMFDTQQASQEISNYIGGVITTNPDMITLSDKDKIKKAGFDLRISFRHRTSDATR